MSANISDSKGMSRALFIGLALFLIITWGTAFTLVSIGVKYMSPMWLVAFRLIIGAVFLIFYVVATGAKFPKLTDRRWLWYSGLGLTGMTLPFFLTSTGQLTVDSGLSAIIVGAMPIMTIILAHFFAHERLNLFKSIGFFIGFLGIVILFLPDNLSLELVSDWKAQLLILGGAFCYAVTTVAAKRAPKTPPSVGAAMMLICAAIIGVIAALFTGLPEALPAMPGLLAAAGLGLGSTAVATIVYLYVIEQTGPSALARINYFVPVASVIAGIWFLSEPFTWRMVASFIVILIGIFVARLGTRKPKADVINL
jgi:drug/metabolite transporter (DMT)-like permease